MKYIKMFEEYSNGGAIDYKEMHLQNKDVYGDELNTWHNISFEGDEPMFAFSTENGTVMYGLMYESEEGKDFSTTFTKSPFYLETNTDINEYFDTLQESKDKAMEYLKQYLDL